MVWGGGAEQIELDAQQITDCYDAMAGGARPLFMLHLLIVTAKYDQLTCKI
jgi:hypothetical protein